MCLEWGVGGLSIERREVWAEAVPDGCRVDGRRLEGEQMSDAIVIPIMIIWL